MTRTTLAVLVTLASVSGAQHACDLLEPPADVSDASTSDATVYCSVDPVTLEPQDPCPEGYRCDHASPPEIGWNVGECVPQ